MKKIYLLLIGFFLFSCGNKKITSPETEAQDSIATPTDSSEMEIEVVNTVFNLPEVKQKSEEIEKKHHGEIALNAGVIDYPHQNQKGYYRIVMEATNSELYPLPLYTFDVFFPSMEIFYWDTIHKKQIPLEEWRQQSVK